MKNDIVRLKLKKDRVGPVIGRHPWIFSGGFTKIPDGLEPGIPVHVVDGNDKFLASGYFGSYSQIAVRVWGYDENEEVDVDFFVKRIRKAFDLRKNHLEASGTDSYRVINSESDFIPGLIVDKYADYLVIQCHTKAIEMWKEQIVEALKKVLAPKGVYEKSDALYRKTEGLDKQFKVLSGELPEEIIITENNLKFIVDVKGGQKTGFFLDQRDKRQALMKYVKGKNVLNCFSYTGGFSVYALAGGAKSVTSIDASQPAVDMVKKNIEINGLDSGKCEYICGDVKEYLKNIPVGKFDIIILDPPAFIKDRHKKHEGIVGYRNINEQALRVLPEGGILATCSCSAHLSLEDFRYLLSEAGGRSKRSMKIIETYTHGLDHPELMPFTESEYLKCYFLEV